MGKIKQENKWNGNKNLEKGMEDSIDIVWELKV